MLFFALACNPTPLTVDVPKDSADPIVESQPELPDDSEPLESIGPVDSTPDVEVWEDPDPPATYAAFFDPNVVQEIRIELSADAIRTLNRRPDDYVEGNATVNGISFPKVGVRLKGSSTFQDLNGKAAFKIKLNEYISGQKYGDLERITLNNMISDGTQAKEVIIYQLWEMAGMTGPKCSFAQVYVNDELYGLYANVESMDDHWVERRYSDNTGDLWGTGDDSADFTRNGLSVGRDGLFSYWILKSGVGDQAPFNGILTALQNPSGDWFADMDPYIDTDQFLDFWAWCVIVGNQDGYPFNLNDVILYGDPADGGRFDFSPWGVDESYDSSVVYSYVSGVLATSCLQDTLCTGALISKVRAGIEIYSSLPVEEITAAAYSTSEEAMRNDPRRSWYISTQDVGSYRNQLRSTQDSWVQHLNSSMGF
ncbi:MAG TPA: CotH kinase family protein [Myxococcota bacterium]|nr:CotH kinase family protein [Myxococcota bacterium]